MRVWEGEKVSEEVISSLHAACISAFVDQLPEVLGFGQLLIL